MFAKTLRLLVAFSSISAAFSAPVASMADITYWVGSGSNHSALVIQWEDSQGPDSVVWGYQWNDAELPTVETMLLAIAGNITFQPTVSVPAPVQPIDGDDTRLTLVADVYDFGTLVSSLSYNQVGLPPGEFSQTVRTQAGYGALGESWTTYSLGNGLAWPGVAVFPADYGIGGLALSDGDWFGLAYTAAFPAPDYDPVSFSFAAPESAVTVPEPTTAALIVLGLAAISRRRYVQTERV